MTATDPVQRQPAGSTPCYRCVRHIIPLWECRFCDFFRDRVKSLECWKRRGRDLCVRKAVKLKDQRQKRVVVFIGNRHAPMMKRLTPFQAIRRECRFCGRTTPDRCLSDCVLNKKTSPRKSPTGRIWSYCRQTCLAFPCGDGNQLWLGASETCWLFPFRNGKNPYLAKLKDLREKIRTEEE